MTCKDCLHYELCKYNTYQEAHYFGKDKEIYIKIDNNSPCKFFTRYVNGVFESSMSIPFSEFGNTTFLTREEAEKALEEKK